MRLPKRDSERSRKKDRDREVLIYAPEGGHGVVPIEDLEYVDEEVNYELSNQ